jgi:hypothetical protein
MNAFNTVDMAAACIITSTEVARALGIPEEAWIYPVGGAGRDDNEECAFSTSPVEWLRCSSSFSLEKTQLLQQQKLVAVAGCRFALL